MNTEYIEKIKDISSTCLVVSLFHKKDLEALSFLRLEKNILSDIKSSISQKKSCTKTYFLGRKNIHELVIFYVFEENYDSKINFYGKNLPKLSERICLYSPIDEEIIDLFDVCQLSRYKFENYKAEKKQKTTQVLCTKNIRKKLEKKEETIKNIFLARDLGETPACDLTPEIFSKIVSKTKFQNVKVRILSYKDIQKKGLGLIEAVGKGSDNKPCMIILEHITDKKKPVIGLVGKGVTYDTGGNQIKPGDYMYEMKGDMGGAAVSFALMKELDRKNLDINIVTCLCLAENVVSSNAYKPSDILTGYTGKTVEIIHTDAEGRLVLADGVSYLGKNYSTNKMITLATLTGACMVALGFRYAGIMGNDEKFISKVLSYSQNHSEKYVRLPLDEFFIEKTKSEIADYKNLDRTVHAGASMGAAFLTNFLENNEKYTHIDIAGAYINEGEAYGKMPKGMTGFGVESLSEIIEDI